MSGVVDEISVKLGIQAGDLKAALLDSNASIKQFGEGGAHAAEGFTGALKETHHSIRQLHQFFVAGGIVEVVKSFFEMAIKGAEESTEKNDKNVEAVRRFGEALKDTHGIASKVAVNVVGTFNRIGESIGEGLLRQKAYLQDLVAGTKEHTEALEKSFEIEESTQKVVEADAELRKKHGAELIELGKQLNEQVQKQKELLEGQKPVTQQLIDLAKDMAKQRAIIDNLDADAVTRLKARVQLAKDETEAIKIQGEERKKQNAEIIDDRKHELEIDLASLTNDQKIAKLGDEVRAGFVVLNALKKQGVDVALLQADLDNKRLLLAKAIGEEEKKGLENRKKIAGSISEELELLHLQQKVILGISTGAEENRLKVIKLQRQERALEIEVLDILNRSITDKLTPADIARLKELEKQEKKIEDQIKAINLVTANTDQAAQSATKVAEAWNDGIDKVYQVVDGVIKLKEETKGFIDQWEGFSVGFSQTGNVNNLGDAELSKLIANLKSQIQDRVSATRSVISPYNINDPSDPVGSASLIDPLIGVLQQNLNNALAAQKTRLNQSLAGGGTSGLGDAGGASGTQKSLTQIGSTLASINSKITDVFYGRG